MRIKLLQIPAYHTDPSDESLIQDVAYLPPLGLSTLTGFLKKENIHIEQDDLDIRTFHHNSLCKDSFEKIDLSLFNNQQRIDKFIKKYEDKELEDTGRKILKLTKTKNFDVIGLSLSTFGNISGTGLALVIGKLLKKESDPLIIFGGSSINWSKVQTLLKTPFIDCGIECNSDTAIGELSLLNFCKQIEKGKGYDKVLGVVYLKNDKLVKNHTHYKKEEEYQFVTPCFDGLPLHLYEHELSCEIKGEPYSKKILILPYRFIRGCPNSCAFCCHSTNPTWSALEPEKVASDLKYLSKRYGTNFFFFLNTNINPTYKYANSFAEAIKKDDVSAYWTDCANFSQMDKTLLRKLKDAGAVRLMFGLESVSNKILNYIGKNVKIKHAERVIKEAHDLGIFVGIELICGFPYETDEDVIKTINFLKKNKKCLAAFSLNKFYLDGKFLGTPEQYGIKILEESRSVPSNWTSKGFDELKRVNWKEKVKRINESYDKILVTAKQIEQDSIYQLFFKTSHPKIKCLNNAKDHFYKNSENNLVD